ncbi:hypothetical protein Lesp02_07210 [Lentzea sp. NBRC 105346]|nr:hypothetical protein Lesp02_07210 [Lentzea sp. NBRC 105346]
MTETPPTSASEQSWARSDCVARCSATKEEEHAVSTVTAGPSKPNVYDSRPDATAVMLPDITKPSTDSPASASRGP